MNEKHVAIIVAAACLMASVWSVHNFHNGLQPDLSGSGDYTFYLNCCTETPGQQHLVIPLLLRVVNTVLQYPTLTVYIMMVLGFFLTYFSIFLLSTRLSENIYSGVVSVATALIFGSGLNIFLTATALKNLYGIVFLLLSLVLLLDLEKRFTGKKLGLFAVASVLTALTHSIPVFLLLQTLTVYYIYRIYKKQKKHVAAMLTIPLLTFIAFTALFFSGRLAKFTDLLYNVTFNLPETVTLNWVYAYTPYLLIYLWSIYAVLVSAVIAVAQHRKHSLDPFFVGLMLNAGTLMFLGEKSLTHYSYSGRFHENLLAFISLLFGYIVSGKWLELKK